MSDANTLVNAPRSQGAWFVYRFDEDDCIIPEPVGVYGASDELLALRAANKPDHHCIWWPYGWTFEQADAEHWTDQ